MAEVFKKDSGNQTKFMEKIVESMMIRQVIFSLGKSMKARRRVVEDSMMPRRTKCMKETLRMINAAVLESFIEEMEKY
jgi:hypothetical protein